jgi:hypothetical protein
MEITTDLIMLEARNRMSNTHDAKIAQADFVRMAAYRQPMNNLLTSLESA